MATYEQIPDDFHPDTIAELTVISTERKDDTSTVLHIVTDPHGRSFAVHEALLRVDILSDHLTIIQTDGEQTIGNPSIIRTEMWPSSPGNLPQRAIAAAMREYFNRLH